MGLVFWLVFTIDTFLASFSLRPFLPPRPTSGSDFLDALLITLATAVLTYIWPLGISLNPNKILPVAAIYWANPQPVHIRFGLAFGLLVGGIIGIFIGFTDSPIFGFVAGLIFALLFSLIAILFGGLSTWESYGQRLTQYIREKVYYLPGGFHYRLVGTTETPLTNLRVWGIPTIVGIVLILAIIGGLLFGLAVWALDGVLLGITNWNYLALKEYLGNGLIAGLFQGLSMTLLFSIILIPLILMLAGGGAIGQHAILRKIITQAGHLPQHPILFLDEMADHLLLRKVGSGYIFIHRALLDYFADLHTHPPKSTGK